MRRTLEVLLVLGCLTACSSDPPRPVAIDTAHDACAFCRMAISGTRTAAQLIAAHEEPLLFDDLGCLSDYLTGRPSAAAGRVAYVADHHTGAWVRAEDALYTRVPGLATPMNSQLVAHADATSRAADPVIGDLPLLGAAEIFSPHAFGGGE